jgi:signal recognition particle subunit SRP19
MCREYPKLSYTINPPTKPKQKSTSAGDVVSKSKKSKKSTDTQAKTRQPKKLRTRPPNPPQPTLKLEDRLPLHSPLIQTGIAVSSIKRDLDQEKEAKKNAIAAPAEEGGKEGAKQPKMKRIMVRGKR